MNNKQKGALGEQIACAYLKKQGYKILTTNYHASRMAEIDIIAREKNTLVFTEVKLRTGIAYGAGREAVTKQKQNAKRTAALYYHTQEKLRDDDCRFDVVEISFFGEKAEIEHIKNAF